MRFEVCWLLICTLMALPRAWIFEYGIMQLFIFVILAIAKLITCIIPYSCDSLSTCPEHAGWGQSSTKVMVIGINAP